MPFFLKKRSIVSLVVVFCLLVAAMAASAILFDRQTRDATAVQHTLQVQGHLTRVLSLLQDAETGQRGYLLTGNPAYLQPFTSATSDLDKTIEGLGLEVADNVTQVQALGTLRLVINDKLDELLATIALKAANKSEEVLRRTLGEHIAVETVLAGGLWRTHADPGQLENAIVNLAVNSRDAMPDGGKLTIETANASLDETYAAQHVDVPAGQYVLLAVSDTGQGMPADVVAKAFEPFFTTKGLGKGTGLGLSQVLGFVRQSGGHVKIYSEPHHGTTIKIYLPRFMGAADELLPVVPVEEAPAGQQHEVVLVVEDEERMLQVSCDAFRELGYTVLQAGGPIAALRVIDVHPEITLLFTDVVMPEMNGRQLAREAVLRLPKLKILYTTGFSRNAVIHNGVLDQDVNFISKPFTIEQLASKARAVLDGAAS
ncbi:MAG TPA: CHASE3 domain-containing protein [Geobacterales bacterium]|nr:CHASE3 domain-containing protein [Geobacterales bacterium]